MPKRRLALAAPALLVGGAASAALPAGVEAALQDFGTDALYVAGAVLAAIVAIYALKFIAKGLYGYYL